MYEQMLEDEADDEDGEVDFEEFQTAALEILNGA